MIRPFSGSLKKLLHTRQMRFAAFVWKRFDETDILQTAGSLTFTTLLALVPVFTIILVVVTMFPTFSHIVDTFMLFIRNIIMPAGAQIVQDYLNRFQQQAGRLTAVSIIGMTITSLLLVQTVEQTFNRIWRVQHQRRLWVRIPIHIMLLLFLPIAIGLSLTLSSNLFNVGSQLVPLAGSLKILQKILTDTLILTLVYRITPNCHVPLAHALLGAGFTALLLEIAKWGFGVYLRHFHSYELIYGTFATIPIFLIWLHLLWSIVLGGALLTACCNYWQGNTFLRTQAAHTLFDDTVALLLLLAKNPNTPMKLHDFRRNLNIGYDRAENLLVQLQRCQYVRHIRQSWQLARPPESILLSELFCQFVYDPAHAGTRSNSTMQKLMQRSIQPLDISLAQLLQKNR